MRTLKFGVIFIFLAIFIHGKAHTSFQNHHQKKFTKKNDYPKFLKKLSDNKSNERQKRKRKYRTKGVEVAVIQIANLSFKQTSVYKDFDLARVENTYSSFLHCVEQKRGPPSV